MRITYLLGQGGFYGSEKHCFELACHFRKSNQVQFLLLSGGEIEKRLDLAGIEYVVLGDTSWCLRWSTIRSLFRLVKGFQADIIHGHQPRAAFWGMLLARLLGVKGAATIHSNPKSHACNYFGLKSKSVYAFHWLVRCITILLSSGSLYVSKDALNRGFRNSKTQYIHNWIPENAKDFSVERRSPSQLNRYVCVCSIVRSKGIYELSEFFAKIYDRNFAATLDIVGDGSVTDIQEFSAWLIRNGMSQYITLLGYKDQVGTLLGNYDAFICLSHDETFGLAYVEAMSRGLPVIASDIGILREIVYPGNYFVRLDGLSCERFEELIVRADYSELSRENVRWVNERYLIHDQMRKIKTFYESLLS